MTWKYSDGSGGAIPRECRIEMFAQDDGMLGSMLCAYFDFAEIQKKLGIG
jgi:hypothetical protein